MKKNFCKMVSCRFTCDCIVPFRRCAYYSPMYGCDSLLNGQYRDCCFRDVSLCKSVDAQRDECDKIKGFIDAWMDDPY